MNVKIQTIISDLNISMLDWIRSGDYKKYKFKKYEVYDELLWDIEKDHPEQVLELNSEDITYLCENRKSNFNIVDILIKHKDLIDDEKINNILNLSDKIQSRIVNRCIYNITNFRRSCTKILDLIICNNPKYKYIESAVIDGDCFRYLNLLETEEDFIKIYNEFIYFYGCIDSESEIYDWITAYNKIFKTDNYKVYSNLVNTIIPKYILKCNLHSSEYSDIYKYIERAEGKRFNLAHALCVCESLIHAYEYVCLSNLKCADYVDKKINETDIEEIIYTIKNIDINESCKLLLTSSKIENNKEARRSLIEKHPWCIQWLDSNLDEQLYVLNRAMSNYKYINCKSLKGEALDYIIENSNKPYLLKWCCTRLKDTTQKYSVKDENRLKLTLLYGSI